MSNLDSPNQEPFSFLKTVVDQGSGQANKNGTDSDKENEQKDVVTAVSSSNTLTKEYTFNLSSETSSLKGHSTMSKEDTDMWDDFYNEEDFGAAKNEGSSKDNNDFDILRPERRLDKVEEEEEDDYVDDSNTTELNSRENCDNKDDEDKDGSDKNDSNGSKRKRKKRLFKRRAPPSLSPKSRTLLPIGGSHPNLSDNNNNRHGRNGSVSSDQNGHLETMSETSGGERKLLRRKQVSRPRCAGPKPNGDRLQQKYQELEQLMLKPLPNPAVYVQQTRQQMLRLQGLSPQNHNSSHQPEHPVGLPPTGQHPVPRDTDKVDRVIQIIDEDTNQVYSTMKTVHANKNSNNNRNNIRNNRPNTAHPRRRPLSGQRQLRQKPRPQSADQARPSTAYSNSEQSSSLLSSVNGTSTRSSRGGRPSGRVVNGRRPRSDSSASGGSHRRSDRSESGSKERDRDYGSSSFEDGTDSRSASRSPGRAIQTTDNHLKNSANPALRQWLKVKDKEYRQQKREERKKKSRERAEKQEEEIKKQEFLKNAEEKVKEWMKQKRKEAWRQAKEERKRKKDEEKEIEQQIKHTESLRGKMFTPIQRPAGKYEGESKSPDQQQQENNAPTTPQPPKSKFVYKRPVSGRVRLMKLQQERKEDTKKLEEKKKEMDEMLAKEKEKKMRMSYDQWLLKKREDDYSKRRAAAKQRALAKSDPELDRIVPEMARRRIENIKRGKKRIDTGDSSINNSVNKSFGGGDFGEEGENASPSYRLEVSGDKKSLKQRPSSAKNTSSINPKKSKSPRRPQSANPRVQALMDESDDSSLNPDNSFKLPFPPELGIPKYVAARQEKLFSGQVVADAKANANALLNAQDGGSNSKALSVDGGGEKPVSEDNETGVQNGSDEIDAEAEYEPELKTVADSLITSKPEEVENEKAHDDVTDDSSFFVTHGNFDKDGSDHDEEQAADGSTEVENKSKNGYHFVSDNEDKQSEKENAHEENVESGNAEKDLNPSNTESVDNDLDNVDAAQNEIVEGNVVPPLNIGDDDSAEFKYEEEESVDANQQQKDEEERMDEGGSSVTESNLLGDVEPVSESMDVKSSIKHVSFSDEATIHMDPLAGLSNDDEYFYDYDDRAQTDQGYGRDEDEDGDRGPVSTGHFDYENEDEIEGYPDDEAEDERGGYFDDGTPRDDF